VDADRRRMVLHGGETDAGSPPSPARQLDLGTLSWRDWPVTGQPTSSRQDRGLVGSPAALDTGESVVLALCDCADGGAFELRLGDDTWTPAPGGDAGQVSSAALVYDAASDRAITFGGRLWAIGDVLTRTMAYDFGPRRLGWRELPPTPFQLQDQAVAVNQTRGVAYAFGGQEQDGDAVDQLWRLDLAAADTPGAWSLVGAAGPAPRMGASLTFIDENRAILFGGYADGEHLGDAWMLDVTSVDAPVWSPLGAGGVAPPARAAHGAAWDAEAGRLLIVGGTAGSIVTYRVLDDAWALELDPDATPATVTPPGPTPTATRTSGTPAVEAVGVLYLPITLKRAGP